ncbi:MAG: chalcone isomerase family protein [Desulfobacteraceae bacterium]|nr:chalcone isomerase family protein [Desulfobacteraceae bacterium]
MNRTYLHILLSFAFSVLMIAFVSAAGASPALGKFSGSIQAGDRELVLRGQGLMRYLIFDLYNAALYLPENLPAEKALEDVPKRLEAEYLRSLKKSDFNRSVHEYIVRNAGQQQYESLLPAIREHNALYRDVSAQDRYALSYVPGEGTTLELNGRPLGTVGGAAFASALFSIWLGDDPIDADLKRQLLNTQ